MLLPFTLCMRLSEYSALILKMPVRCSPKITMMMPATLASRLWYCRVICPTDVATAPSRMKTTLNPAMNRSELIMTERISLRSAV